MLGSAFRVSEGQQVWVSGIEDEREEGWDGMEMKRKQEEGMWSRGGSLKK